MQHIEIKKVLQMEPQHNTVEVKGWVRSFRSNRFIALNDGSTIKNIQCVIDFEKYEKELIDNITIGAALKITGILKESQGKGQAVEIEVSEVEILGLAPTEDVKKTILSPKRHSLETLREQAHLRVRTNAISSVMRVRAALSFAIHKYFTEKGFFHMHSPILTASDAEGAGEMFQVTTLDLENLPKTEDGKVDYSKDFFKKSSNLTVSGQLEAETYAMGLGKVYTFGPTFRAENSNTTRHLAEFWMVEPEMAFYDLDMNMDLAEDFIKSVVSYALEHCKDDLEFLQERLEREESQKPKNQRSAMPLIDKLNFVVENNFKRVSYTEAIDILRDSKPNKSGKFNYTIDAWGADLQSEHERYLVEKHFKKPVILFDYPADIKAFYMRLNEDGKTVRAMDVLFPGIGEIVGGSQREERYDVLLEKVRNMGISEEEIWWYLDLRKFGSVTHSGFGLGFERLVLFVTGMTNIRDVIPYPRYPEHLEF